MPRAFSLRLVVPLALCWLLVPPAAARRAAAQPPAPGVLPELAELPSLTRAAIGVTRAGTRIDCLIAPADLDLETRRTRVLLVGGLPGDQASLDATLAALRWFYTHEEARAFHDRYVVSAVPCANPDGLRLGVGPANGAGGNPASFPADGLSYHSPTDPEAAYLWRWIGMHAPDLVLDVRGGERGQWRIPGTLPERLAERLSPRSACDEPQALVVALGQRDAAETGRIAALQLQSPPAAAPAHLAQLLAACDEAGFRGPSPARAELQRRLRREPLEVARQLSRHYGHELRQVVYIPAVALIGRLRLGELDGDAGHRADVERIVLPYVRGEAPSAPKSGSGLSGHLIFCELARRAEGSRRQRYVELARVAADLAFEPSGRIVAPLPFHHEMSDALFMGGPILAGTGRLTGEPRYYDACVAHLRAMRQIVLRDDGLYRHSPLDEAAWGRGNGFAALGLALCLGDLPPDHAARAELLEAFRQHQRALAKHQDETGCWHQVIDRPESYRELSCTCMILFAIVRGVRSGWLDPAEFTPVIDRAWYAVRTRIDDAGRLVDVCTGTGKQKSLRAYYDRPAILGPDPRGGAMALLATTELAAWRAE